MAKSAAKKKSGSKKRGKPERECPKCGTMNHVKQKICTKAGCGYKFKQKTKKSTTAQTTTTQNSSVLNFVLKSKGIDTKAIARFENNEAVQFIVKHGSAALAIEEIKKAEKDLLGVGK